MNNPLSYPPEKETTDISLIEAARSGSSRALNALLSDHHPFIYNIALKMLNNVPDAQDAAQEVLIKIITHLSQYDPAKAGFRTWLYRITFNHVLNFRKSAYEKYELTFDSFFEYMANVPDRPITDDELETYREPLEEAKIACTAGMLICLDRPQRLTYIVGDIFRIDHQLAAQIFEITPDNFRQKLSRARKDLHEWMHNRCGLVNTQNPCRCRNKTKSFIQAGQVDPNQMKWLSGYRERIFEVVEKEINVLLTDRDQIYREIFRTGPFKETKSPSEVVASILQNERFSTFFGFEDERGAVP